MEILARTRRRAHTSRLALAGASMLCGVFVACTQVASNVVGDAAAAPSACVAAGGQCGASACSTLGPQSCGAVGGACCLDGVGAACAAEGGKPIAASSYDQSCRVDSDCVAIGVGNACYPCEVLCPGAAAIGTASLAQYMSDIADSPAGKGNFVCDCPFVSDASVCCSAGACSSRCFALPDAGEQIGDAESRESLDQ